MANKVKKSTAKTADGSIFSPSHIINVSSLGEGGGPTGGISGTAGSGTELYTGAEFEDYEYLVYTPTTKTKTKAEMDALFPNGHPYDQGRTWTGTVKRISDKDELINYLNSKGATGSNLWEVLTWARAYNYLVLNKEYTAISGTWEFEGTEDEPLPDPPYGDGHEYPTTSGRMSVANMGGYLRFRPNTVSVRFSLQDADGNKLGGSIASSRPGTLWRFYLESDPTEYNTYQQVNPFSFGAAGVPIYDGTSGLYGTSGAQVVDHYGSNSMAHIETLCSAANNAIAPEGPNGTSGKNRVVAEAGGLPTENMLFHIDGQFAPSYPQLGRTSSNPIDALSDLEDRSWYDLGNTQHIFELDDLESGEPHAEVTNTENGPLFTASKQTAYRQNTANNDFATNTAGTLTTSFWIKPNDVTEHGIMCLGEGTDTKRGKWKITSTGEVEYTINDSISVTSSAITAGNWVNITTVREGSSGTVSLKIYINGVEDVTSTNSTPSTPAGTFKGTIIGHGGGTTYGATDYYDGLFGTVTMWNTALTPLQIAQHIGATAPLQ